MEFAAICNERAAIARAATFRLTSQTLLVMRLTVILLFSFCLNVCANGYGQKISITRTNASLQKVFADIRKQAGYHFMYTSDLLEKAGKINLDVKDETIENVLNACFKNQPLTYSIVEKVVVIKEKIPMHPEIPRAVLISISGIVTGENGEGLEGVNITVRGRARGTTTNAQGRFVINAEKGEILVFSFIGYSTKEIPVSANPVMNVALSLASRQMNEVVVTALGITKEKRAIGYSTTELDGSKFTQSRETNIGNALTGQVAGVSVAGVATGPSGSSRVVIRGNASLKQNNQPLYVIDGVPFDNRNQGSAGQWGGADFGDGLSTINPDDVETIQVLKGVAASSLYGYRGANGAILITTKSGSKSKGFGVELNNNLTVNEVIDLRKDIQYEYGHGYNGTKPTSAYGASSSAFASWGAKLDGSPAINFAGDTYPYQPYKDNFKNFFERGITNQSSIALTGSNDKGHFRLGLSNMYMKPVIPNSHMKQQGLNFNGTFNVTPKLQMILNANYVFEQVKNRASFSDAPGNQIASLLYLASSFDVQWLKPAVNASGVELVPNVDDVYTNNPYFVANYFQNNTSRNRLTGGLTLKYDLTGWLSIQGQVTRDGYILNRTEITPTGTQFLYGDNGFLTQTTTDYQEINTNLMLEANKKLGDFSLQANLGGNSQDQKYSVGGIYGAGPFQVPYFYSASNIVDKPFDYQFRHYRVNSLFGSVDAGYKNFLFLTVTGRNDWYSTLNINSNNFLYPSISSSFIFSDVINMPSWISFGKLRAAYGRSSNGTEPYQNQLTYQLEGYAINGRPIGNITQDKIPNKFLKPVKISEQELGLNLQFLNNRIGIDVAVYHKKTEDDILDVAISPSSGYLSNIVNIGKLQNRGIEFLLTAAPVRSPRFKWNTSFNIAVNNSKVLALTPPENSPIPVSDDAYPRWGDAVSVQHIVGLPYAQIVGYAYKRNESGQVIYDADGYPLQNGDLPVPLGSAIYKTTGGFSNDLSFKNFNLSFLFDFKYGAKIYSGTNLLFYSNGQHTKTLQGREGGFIGEGVTEDGRPNTKSVMAQTYFYHITTGDNQISEEFVYDASFIKFRSLSLGYSLPPSVLKNSFIKSFNISLIARNLAILMKHTPNIDPESNLNNTNAQGLELAGYPATRNYGININVKF